MTETTPSCGCAVEVLGMSRRVKHREGCIVQAERVAARESSLAEMALAELEKAELALAIGESAKAARAVANAETAKAALQRSQEQRV